VTNPLQQRISRMSLGAASAALMFVFVFGVVANQSAQAQTLTVLYSFTGSSDGAMPVAGLVMDASGNLYGTTFYGGDLNCGEVGGCGTVFQLTPTAGGSWNEKVLHAFDGKDGLGPAASLIFDDAGNLYGTTQDGGRSTCPGIDVFGCGVVFRLDQTGALKVLYNFCPHDYLCTHGAFPNSELIRDAAGDLYATAAGGGDGACNGGCGVVFKLSNSGKETAPHTFCSSGYSTCKRGAYPDSGLVRDAEGNFYGTTGNGGDPNCYGGCGLVYKLSKTGTFTVLHTFHGPAGDGCFPGGTPALDKNGNLYGITGYCGSRDRGTVWKVSKNGKETVLHNFTGYPDGKYPGSGLIIDAKGNLYGVTGYGGAHDWGTVFTVNRTGKETVLHSFRVAEGAYPAGNLMRDAAGNLYGTTTGEGSGNGGTVWKLAP